MYFYILLFLTSIYLVYTKPFQISPGSVIINKYIGNNPKLGQYYEKCADHKEFVHYEIDLYQYEKLQIQCPMLTSDLDTSLKPIEDGKYYNKSRYTMSMEQRTDGSLDRETTLIEKTVPSLKITKSNRLYTIDYNGEKQPMSIVQMYFDCNSISRTGELTHLSTVQVNIMPKSGGVLRRDSTIEFDKYRWAPITSDGLTYVKSLRLGTKFTFYCKASVKGTTSVILRSITPTEYVHNGILKYTDHSQVYNTRNLDVNRHELKFENENDMILNPDECLKKFWCDGYDSRKFILVYTDYTKYNGLHTKTPNMKIKTGT